MLAMRVKTGAAVTALCGIMACGTGPSGLDSPEVELRTEPEYALSAVDSRYEVFVAYVIRNLGPESAFVPANCLDDYELDAETLVGGEWESAIVSYEGRVIASCLRAEPAIEIPPGGELPGQLDLLSRPGVAADALYGAYRLFLPQLRDYAGRDIGPVRSGVFVVGRPDSGG